MLRGMFAIVWFDKVEESFYAVEMNLNKPFFFSEYDGFISLASR